MAGNNRFFRLARRISVHLAIHPADQIKPPDECLFIHDALVIGSGLFWILGCISRVSGVSEIDMLEFPLIGCKPNKRDFERVLIYHYSVFSCLGNPSIAPWFLAIESSTSLFLNGSSQMPRIRVWPSLMLSKAMAISGLRYIAVRRDSCDRHLLGAASVCLTFSQIIEERNRSHAYRKLKSRDCVGY